MGERSLNEHGGYNHVNLTGAISRKKGEDGGAVIRNGGANIEGTGDKPPWVVAKHGPI